MSLKTTHIFPVDDGWVVKRPQANRRAVTYATQKEAVDAAREFVLRAPAGQIVVHSKNGSVRSQDLHGMPVIQRSPVRSKLGTKAIERAVSAVVRRRLERAL
jgi:hypothetical protein